MPANAIDHSTSMSAGRRRPTSNSSRSNLSRVPYLPGLDGMRALAVVAVIVYHANSSWLQGGFIGVEVFFVISGYLITLLLISEHEKNGRVDMRQFWIRRMRRLLPALFVMLAALIVWTSLFERDALGKLRGDVIGGLAYVSNWYQIFTGAGYSASNDFAPLRHLWSLAVEEQFYFIWPLVMAALLRKGSRNVADLSRYLFGGAVVVSIVVALLYHPGPIAPLGTNQGVISTETPEAYWSIGGRLISKGDALYLSTLSRSTGLLLGAAFAMIWRPVAVMRGPMRRKGRLLDLFALVGFLVLALISVRVGFIGDDNVADAWLFRGGLFIAGIATLMMIMAVTHSGALTSRALSGPVTLWIGTRSYGLYLYHWPIFQIVRNTAGTKLRFHEFVLCMVAAVIITELSYRHVETPIRQGRLSDLWRRRGQRSRRRRERRGPVLIGAVVGAGLTVFAGASLVTAELKQNEVAESIAANDDLVCDVLTEDCFGTSSSGASSGDDEPGDASSPAGSDTENALEEPADVPDTAPIEEDIIPEIIEAPERFALGDSVMKGAAAALIDQGFVVDAAESRSFAKGVEIAQALQERELLPREFVIHLGTNGPITSEEMAQMMEAVSSVPEVLLIRNDIDRPYEAANNDLMLRAASANANVQVLYWDGLAGSCQGDCLYQDGFHLKSDGAAYYAALILGVLDA